MISIMTPRHFTFWCAGLMLIASEYAWVARKCPGLTPKCTREAPTYAAVVAALSVWWCCCWHWWCICLCILVVAVIIDNSTFDAGHGTTLRLVVCVKSCQSLLFWWFVDFLTCWFVDLYKNKWLTDEFIVDILQIIENRRFLKTCRFWNADRWWLNLIVDYCNKSSLFKDHSLVNWMAIVDAKCRLLKILQIVKISELNSWWWKLMITAEILQIFEKLSVCGSTLYFDEFAEFC